MKLELVLRKMEKGDEKQLLEIYQRFAEKHVGCSRRDMKYYRRLLRKKGNLHWVAFDKNIRAIGYAFGVYEKRRKRGRITEIVVNPDYDFTVVAKLLIEKLQSVFIEKDAAVIDAGTIKNPFYSKVFPDMGFVEVETDGVFMYTVLDVSQFLHEIAPIITSRLKRLKDWSGLVQIQCSEYSLFFKKTREEVEEYFWTNVEVDCQIDLDKDTLAKLLLGVVDIMDAHETNKVTTETKLSNEKTKQLLKTLFPKNQFLALDYW